MNNSHDITKNVNNIRLLQEENKSRRIKTEEATSRENRNPIFSELSIEEEDKQKYLLLFTNKDNYTSQECEEFWSLFQKFYHFQNKNANQYNFCEIIFPEDHQKILSSLTYDKNTNFSHCTFTDKIYFSHIIFNNDVIFENITFKKEAIFKDTTFNNNVTFRGTRFNDWVSFKNIIIKKKLDLSFIKANDIIDLSDSTIQSINLEHSRISELGFLRVKGHKTSSLTQKNFGNRETARIVKSHFERLNNITESNKYFAIEQELYLDELRNNKLFDTNKYKNIFVLYLNKYVSYFGIDWIRPLLVIFIFGFLASFGFAFLQHGTEDINFTNSRLLLLGAFLYSLLVYYFYHKKLWVALIASIIIFSTLLIGDSHLRDISNNISKLINPLNIFKPKANYFENIAMYGMIVKLGMSVLIYQFIMAFRQNTRRK